MSNEEVGEVIDTFLKDNEVFKFMSVDNVNHKPHPFMIGPRHISHASDKHMGRLGEETLKAVPCAQPGCRLPYDQHTLDKVVFLQLKRDASSEEVRDILADISGQFLASISSLTTKRAFDGFAFVETPEQFRIHE